MTSPSRQRGSPERDGHLHPFVQRLMDNLPGMAYRCRNDPDWTMDFVSGGARQLTGLPPRALVGEDAVPYARLIHPDDRDRVWREVQQAANDGHRFQVTYRILPTTGGERWVWEQGCVVRGPDGVVEAIEGFITDITERVDLARQVEDREAERRTLIEQPLVGVYVIRSGRFDYVNERLAEIFGYTVEELQAMESIMEVVHPDDRDLVESKISERLGGVSDALRYEFKGLCKGGAVCHVEVHGRRMDSGGGPVVMGILIDVTERRRAQRRYHQAQKMEALGELAAGVAHDFRNVLAVVKTTAQLSAAENEGNTALQNDLADILDAVDRGAALSRQLMKFGQPAHSRTTSVSLSDIVRDAAPVLERTLGAGVELCCSLTPDLPAVRMDPSEVEEMVTNLVFNARDAMPDGGAVTVRTYTQPRGPQEGRKDQRDVPHVVLEVIDTGIGMSDEVQRRIFEPYFTTKGDDGTGLGLANVWKVCRDVGGMVTVDSESGVGSTFRVFLPIDQPREAGGSHPDR